MAKQRRQPKINTLFVPDPNDSGEPFVMRTACVRVGQCPHCDRDVMKDPNQLPPKDRTAAGDLNCDHCGGHIYFVTEIGQAGLTIGTAQTVGHRFNQIREAFLQEQSLPVTPQAAKRSIWGDTTQRIGERHQCKRCQNEFTIRSRNSQCPHCHLNVDSEGWVMLFVVAVVVIAISVCRDGHS